MQHKKIFLQTFISTVEKGEKEKEKKKEREREGDCITSIIFGELRKAYTSMHLGMLPYEI